MTADTRNGSHRRNGSTSAQRGTNGRFLPGNSGGPGRPKGTPNRTTIDVRLLWKRILESWTRVDGDALLDQLARDDYKAYLRLIVNVLPKDDKWLGDPPLTMSQVMRALAEKRRREEQPGQGDPAEVVATARHGPGFHESADVVRSEGTIP